MAHVMENAHRHRIEIGSLQEITCYPPESYTKVCCYPVNPPQGGCAPVPIGSLILVVSQLQPKHPDFSNFCMCLIAGEMFEVDIDSIGPVGGAGCKSPDGVV
jgi:hypothetical protein